ncbi:hypothetical protein DSL61_17775 [Vibrio cholerae]|uniref:hypothetical protein n=1 Tax=Vibrio cholerae TaxID=666 RepID=UPI000DE25A76|nr:hypothetical protein [Vibrio cholerae]RBO13866.1 hypothetical protein DSL61_17775 [Vibrio cholerae]
MSFANIMSQTLQLVGFIGSLAGLLVIYHQIMKFKGEKAKDLHGCYVKVRELSKDVESNYPEIVVLLSGITQKHLSIDEIFWFINEPRAFLKIEKYGKLPCRYSKIDLEKGEFGLSEIVNNSKKRMLEKSKIISVAFGVLFLVIIFLSIVLSFFDSEFTRYIALIICLVYFSFVGWGMSYFLSALSNAKDLAGKP